MAESEPRLGKGLGALIGEYVDEEAAAGEPVREVDLSAIRPNPFQPRTGFEDGQLAELVESIRENGLLQPLVVRPREEGWEIVAGERRYRALEELGRERAPVLVRDLTDQQMLVLALVENLQRENLSPLEEATGYRRLIEEFDLTQREVAERLGRSRSAVTNTLRLLDLPDPVRRLVDQGTLTAGHARAVLGLEDEEAQVKLAREVVARDLSVRETERRVRRRREASGEGDGTRGEPGEGEATGGASGEERRAAAVVRRAEQALGRALGTEVSVRLRGEDAGELRVRFHDASDFERLVRRLAGEEAAGLFDGG